MPSIILNTTWSDVSVPVFNKQFGQQPESGTNVAASATVYYQLNYLDRWTFIREVMGTPQALDYSNPNQLIYRLALQYPDNLALYASQFDITPIASPSALALDGYCALASQPETVYSYCWVGITYSSLTYDPTTLYTVEVKTGAQEVTAPNYTYHFVSDGSDIDQTVGVLVPNQEITITQMRVPYFDSSQYISYQSTVNATQFLGYAAGTVLFNPMTSTYSSSIAAGSPVYQVTFSFTWRYVPWNWFLKSDGTWDLVQDDGGNPVFQSSEYNNLIGCPPGGC
jgi:hypothetical protein